MVILRSPTKATPSAQVTPSPVSEIQPAVPLNCVSTPVVVLREKIVTLLLREATYTLLPSGLTTTATAPPKPLPSAQLTPSPISAIQPAVPLSCVNTPVVALRENTDTVDPSNA